MLVLIFIYPQISKICKFRGTSHWMQQKIFHFCPDFHVSLDKQDFQIWSHIKSSFSIWSWFSCIFRFADLEYHEEQLNGFFIGPDFHVSSDQHLCGFRVALRAVLCRVWFSCIFRSAGFVNLEAPWVQLKGFSLWSWFSSSDFQIPRFRVPSKAAEWVFILVLIFMYLQILRFMNSWLYA